MKLIGHCSIHILLYGLLPEQWDLMI